MHQFGSRRHNKIIKTLVGLLNIVIVPVTCITPPNCARKEQLCCSLQLFDHHSLCPTGEGEVTNPHFFFESTQQVGTYTLKRDPNHGKGVILHIHKHFSLLLVVGGIHVRKSKMEQTGLERETLSTESQTPRPTVTYHKECYSIRPSKTSTFVLNNNVLGMSSGQPFNTICSNGSYFMYK